jgi:hypothetical protein
MLSMELRIWLLFQNANFQFFHRSLYFVLVLSSLGLGWRNGWGTALLDGRSRDRSSVVSLENFSVEFDNSMCPRSAQSLAMSTRMLLGVKTASAYGWQPTTFKCRCHGIWKTLPPRSPGPHSPVMGLLYLLRYLSLRQVFYCDKLVCLYSDIFRMQIIAIIFDNCYRFRSNTCAVNY